MSLLAKPFHIGPRFFGQHPPNQCVGIREQQHGMPFFIVQEIDSHSLGSRWGQCDGMRKPAQNRHIHMRCQIRRGDDDTLRGETVQLHQKCRDNAVVLFVCRCLRQAAH